MGLLWLIPGKIDDQLGGSSCMLCIDGEAGGMVHFWVGEHIRVFIQDMAVPLELNATWPYSWCLRVVLKLFTPMYTKDRDTPFHSRICLYIDDLNPIWNFDCRLLLR